MHIYTNANSHICAYFFFSFPYILLVAIILHLLFYNASPQHDSLLFDLTLSVFLDDKILPNMNYISNFRQFDFDSFLFLSYLSLTRIIL